MLIFRQTSEIVSPLARSRSISRSSRATSSAVRRFFMGPSLAHSTEGLPFQVDQFLGSRPEVALQYKRLWTVEHWFRSCKSLLQTRPIYHKCDETIRGHVFCSFLALVLRQELQARLEEGGHELEWADVIGDLDRLQVVEVDQDGKRFLLRSEAQGTCGKVFQAVGVALPPTVQQVSPTTPGEDAAHSATPPG